MNGWKAIIALVVVAGFVVFRFEMQNRTLDSQGVTQVKNWLMAESTRAALPAMQQANAGEAGGDASLEAMARDLQESNFQIASITSHGTGSSVVARVDVRYKGQSRQDGMNVRYLRMQYSTLTGWRVLREASRWDYYASAFGSPRVN